MIKRVENANEISKHGESWRLINEISGRKAAKKGIIKGNGIEERLKKLYSYFSTLLGKVPVVTGDPNEEIPIVLENISIKTGPFDEAELAVAINKLSEGKSPGPDGIPVEVLRRWDLNDINLSYASKLLSKGAKPDLW